MKVLVRLLLVVSILLFIAGCDFGGKNEKQVELVTELKTQISSLAEKNEQLGVEKGTLEAELKESETCDSSEVLTFYGLGTLKVEATPSDSRVQIIKYSGIYQELIKDFPDGILLKAGKYLVKTSASGYATDYSWVEIKPGEFRTFSVFLGTAEPKLVEKKVEKKSVAVKDPCFNPCPGNSKNPCGTPCFKESDHVAGDIVDVPIQQAGSCDDCGKGQRIVPQPDGSFIILR